MMKYREPSRLELEAEQKVRKIMQGQRVGGSLDMFCPELACGSPAWNWVMHQTKRLYMPRISSSESVALFNSHLVSREQTYGEWFADLFPMEQEYAALCQPIIAIAEKWYRTYMLGSAWSFHETTSPSLERLEFTRKTKVTELRAMQYESDGRAGSLTTAKVEGGIVMVHLMDLGGRLLLKQFGRIDPETGLCYLIMNSVVIRSCPACSHEERVFCTCDNDELEEMYSRMFIERRKNCVSLEALRTSHSKFLATWLGGIGSTMPIFPANGKAVTLNVRAILEGGSFNNCVGQVIQSLVEKSQPPRISQRFVCTLQEEAEGEKELDWCTVVEAIRRSVKKEPNWNEDKYEYDNFQGDQPLERTARGGRKSDAEWDFRKEPEIVCEICGKYFKHRGHLNVHVRLTHEDSREYPCNICGKQFGLPSRLNRHIRTVHENIRKFECPICGKLFKSDHSVKRHIAKKRCKDGNLVLEEDTPNNDKSILKRGDKEEM